MLFRATSFHGLTQCRLRHAVPLSYTSGAMRALDDVAALGLPDGGTRQSPQRPFVIDTAILAIAAERESRATEQARSGGPALSRALNDGSIP